MRLLEAIKNATGDVVVICDYDTKNNVLKSLSKEGVFKALTFMNRNDVIEHLLGKMKDQTLVEAAVFFGLKPAIVQSWLPYLYMIDETFKTISPRLLKLQRLKVHLLKNGWFEKPCHQTQLFKDKTILLSYNAIDGVFKRALKQLKTIETVTEITPASHPQHRVSFNRYHDVEKEIAGVATAIRNLIDEGIPIERIAVVSEQRDYVAMIQRVFALFHLPVNTKTHHTLWQFEITQRFFDVLKAQQGDLYAALSKALEAIKPRFNQEKLMRLYVKIIQTVNPFIAFDKPLSAVIDGIKLSLQDTMVAKNATVQGVLVGNVSRLNTQALDHLFVVGCAESYFPLTVSETDYLNVPEKQAIGFDTADEINKRYKAQFKRVIKQVENVTLSYAQQSATEVFYGASFFEELSRDYVADITEKTDDLSQPYAVVYDQLLAKEAYDNFNLYGEKTSALTTLYPMFLKDLTPFDNRFQPLEQPTIDRLLGENIRLSYTKLNSFFSCKFHYLMRHVLYVDADQHTVAMDLGTVVHELLETEILQPTLTDAAFEKAVTNLLENRATYTAREAYLLRHHLKTLKTVFKMIKNQHEKTAYKVYKREEKYTVAYDKATLVGVIDKVMALDDKTGKKLFLVDYKTGSETLVLPRLLYGLNVQLLFYVLLLTASEETAVEITGFFEQTVIPKLTKLAPEQMQDEIIREHSLLKGYTVHDLLDIERIDVEVSQTPFIKGHKVNRSGALRASAKTYKKAELTLWLSHLENMIKSAIKAIFKGTFTIDPKRIGKKDVSCEYCSFKDICFRSERDVIKLKTPKNQDELNHEIQQRGEH